LWLHDFANRSSSRFAFASSGEAAVWSPDGNRIAFSSGASGDETAIMLKSTGGNAQEELLTRLDNRRLAPTSWSADGRFVLFVAVDPKTSSDVWGVSLDGASKPVPFLRSEAAESQAQFMPAPQGPPRWVAFTSNDSGRDEVQLSTFPDAQNRLMVSSGGGHSPRWRADGRELFYVAADGTIMSAAISDNPLRVNPPTRLFQAPRGFGAVNATGKRGPAPWGVTPDGQRFLFVAPTEAAAASQFTVVLNWKRGSGG
jgi:Tol biopolymer transport system component